MKRKVELVRVIKKSTAATMAAATAVTSVGVMPGVASAAEESNYIFDDELSTKLKKNYSEELELQFGLKEYDYTREESIYKDSMGTALLSGGKIQINGGEEMTFEEAGLAFRYPSSYSTFHTFNKEIINKIYNLDDINIVITTPEGYKISGKIPNELTAEDREAYTALLADEQPTTMEDLNAVITKAGEVDSSLYTETSVSSFVEKLNAAKII